MSEVRKDHKRRKLRDGESQLPDGRYRYRYTGLDGKRHDVYSWRLEASDPIPAGKKDVLPLRVQERRIAADLIDGIITDGGNYTVIQLCEKYLRTKVNARQNTLANYKTTMNVLRKVPFGQLRIDKIKEIDAKEFLIWLQQEDGRSYSSIHNIRGVLRPAFALAVKNDYIRKSPFEFPLTDVLVNDSVRREAITHDQERRFLQFISEQTAYKKYYDAVVFLFKTGVRISEFCGLTLSNIDMEKRTITIDHQLQRRRDGTLYIEEPSSKKAATKTSAGERTIPMSDEVYECVKRIIESRPVLDREPVVDGYSGFLFFTEHKGKIRPSVAMDWEHRFSHAVTRYNRIYKDELPKITPHVCRHTYCSNMAKSGMNPKILQYLMGHSDIGVTLNVYTHVKTADAREELDRLQRQKRSGVKPENPAVLPQILPQTK